MANHNSKVGAYTDSKMIPRGPKNPGNGGDDAGGPKQLDRDTIYNDGVRGGSGKLPKNANR